MHSKELSLFLAVLDADAEFKRCLHEDAALGRFR